MIIKSLELNNYRNYDNLCLSLSEGTNILYGDNAQGKTNILEALNVCATTKSHRGSKDKEMIQFDKEDGHIRVFVEKEKIVHRLDMHLKKNKPKGVAVDGIPIKKVSELFGILNIVFFSPEDLSIIKNGPSERRRFMDMELCQINKLYLYNISKYNKVLAQRNNLLKQIVFKPEMRDTLEIWDAQLVSYGSEIIKERGRFIEQLNQIIHDIHKKLSGGREELYIRYEQNTTVEDFSDKLAAKRENDLRFKTTSIGPQRDDLSFCVGDIDLRKYGSQGQQRTAALSLKLAEIELVKSVIRDCPVLLLDDVLSELDSFRQNYLLDSIQNIQTVITCTGLDDFVNHRFNIDKVYRVTDGKVT